MVGAFRDNNISIPLRFNYNQECASSNEMGNFISIPLRFNYNLSAHLPSLIYTPFQFH